MIFFHWTCIRQKIQKILVHDIRSFTFMTNEIICFLTFFPFFIWNWFKKHLQPELHHHHYFLGTWTLAVLQTWWIWVRNPVQFSTISNCLFVCPRLHVPIGSIPSNLLHHRQRIPAYEPWVRNMGYSHFFFCLSFMLLQFVQPAIFWKMCRFHKTVSLIKQHIILLS